MRTSEYYSLIPDQWFVEGFTLFVMNKYNNMCKRKGIDPDINQPFFTINTWGQFVVGIMKPIKK